MEWIWHFRIIKLYLLNDITPIHLFKLCQFCTPPVEDSTDKTTVPFVELKNLGYKHSEKIHISSLESLEWSPQGALTAILNQTGKIIQILNGELN